MTASNPTPNKQEYFSVKLQRAGLAFSLFTWCGSWMVLLFAPSELAGLFLAISFPASCVILILTHLQNKCICSGLLLAALNMLMCIVFYYIPSYIPFDRTTTTLESWCFTIGLILSPAFLVAMLLTGYAWTHPIRPRSKNQCRKCGYPLRFLSTNQCPECGTVTQENQVIEKQFDINDLLK